MLARYSIRAKIVTVAALLLVAMTGLGLLALSSMRAIKSPTSSAARLRPVLHPRRC